MPSLLPSPGACCLPACETSAAAQVPGPQGADGAPGQDGADGKNAFTYVATAFVMPAETATVPVTVLDTTWMGVGQTLYVEVAGYMQVSSITNSQVVVLTNLKDTANQFYLGNAAPATNVIAGKKVSPGGVQGANAVVAVFTGHYAGAAPSQTPSGSAAIGYDLDAPNNVWYWSGSAWF